MPCHHVNIGGHHGIICTARTPRKRCRWCNDWCVALCDAPISSPQQVTHRKTCDAPMCENHRKKIGPDEDLCPEHAKQKASSEMSKPKPAITWPATCLELEAAGYRLMQVRACKLCTAVIEFWRTPLNKFLPLDRRQNGKRSPHQSTCPRAADFRKKPKQEELFR